MLGPLWYITVIMGCYCLVPALQKGRRRLCGWKRAYVMAAAAAAAGYLLALVTGINTIYFLTFAIGYGLSARKCRFSLTKPESFAFTVFAFGMQILRLVLRAAADGTPVYQTYTFISHMVLGIWILWFFLAFNEKFPKLTGCLAQQKWLTAANDISLYVYLTHCCFCKGRLNMYQLTDQLLPATVGFAAATLVSAVVLKGMVTWIQRILPVRSQASI